MHAYTFIYGDIIVASNNCELRIIAMTKKQ